MKSHGILRLGREILTALGWGCLFWLMLPFSWASAAQSAAEDEYRFTWLDPDKKIYVLQNRRYTKAKRAHLSAMLGANLNETYRDSINVDLRAGYYFKEFLGVEFLYQGFINRQNNALRALTNASSTALPVIREVRSTVAGLVSWAPWYAKINVFNKILYFDWYFTFGVGRILTRLDTNTVVGGAATFVNQDFTAILLGTGHLFHVGKNFFVRLDYTRAQYRAPEFGNQGDQTWFSNSNFHAGAGYRF